jgi:hypothetical protein
VTFVAENFDPGRTIVIDPSIQWATYYGGTGTETIVARNGGWWTGGNNIGVDRSGNIVFVGGTYSTDFPVTAGAFQTASTIYGDACVVKLTAGGSRIWATYYGGTGTADEAMSVAIDSANGICFAGLTGSSDLPVTAGAFQGTFGGLYDALLVKLDSNGTRAWATYYGGAYFEFCVAVAVDSMGNVILAGITESIDQGLASSGAFQTANAGATDAFLAKFSSGGTRLWGTYCGGTRDEYNRVIGTCTDRSGNIYISGITPGFNFPVTAGAFQTTNYGYNSFLVKFSPNGNRIWGTYYGGTGYDDQVVCATDARNNVFLSGSTSSRNTPVTSGAFQSTLNGNYDIFVVKFDSNGSRRWATYYGGSGAEVGGSIAVDSRGSLLLAGNTNSTDFPVTSGSLPYRSSSGLGNNVDLFIISLDSAGARRWGTYYGGSMRDYANGIVSDRRAFYLSGLTVSTDLYGVTSGSFQSSNAGAEDLFVAKF